MARPARAMYSLASRTECSPKWKIGSRQHGAGVAVAHAFNKMFQRANAAGGHNRYGHGIRHRARQRDVEALSRAVAIHGSQQDFAGAERGDLACILDRVETGRMAAAVGKDLPAVGRRDLLKLSWRRWQRQCIGRQISPPLP